MVVCFCFYSGLYDRIRDKESQLREFQTLVPFCILTIQSNRCLLLARTLCLGSKVHFLSSFSPQPTLKHINTRKQSSSPHGLSCSSRSGENRDSGCLFPRNVWLCTWLSPPELPCPTHTIFDKWLLLCFDTRPLAAEITHCAFNWEWEPCWMMSRSIFC